MFLKICIAFLLATSSADKDSASAKFQHDGESLGKHELTEFSVTEMSRGRRDIQSMYDAERAGRTKPKSGLRRNKRVCYDHVGCFDLPRGKFAIFGRLPSSPEKVRTKFLLFSRRNRKRPIYIDYAKNLTREASALFHQPKKLVFVIHGYTGDAHLPWVLDMRDALNKLADMNVILVDWPQGCKSPFYAKSVANGALVGRQIAVLIQKLMSRHPWAVKTRSVHLVGFSLGAQVAGFCGRYFLKTTGTKIGRITALDAAGPLFQGYDHQITRKDASYVDAIHTRAGTSVLAGNLGVFLPFGDVDFYPNGGRIQPGCRPLDHYCHHVRAAFYFNESIQRRPHCRLKSRPCKSIDAFLRHKCNKTRPHGEMGYYSYRAPGRGRQFLWTNARRPFCRS